VGSRGAERFFAGRGDTAQAAKERVEWEREKYLGRFWTTVYNSVDSAFKAHPGDRAARLAARDTVFTRMREYFTREVRPNVPGVPPGAPMGLRLDNVMVMSRRLYRTGLDDFDAVYAHEGNDLNRAIAKITELARARPKDPFAAVREWLR
jgi:hypothetical protein